MGDRTGRPTKADEEKRTARINPRFTDAERAQLAYNAAALGISTAEFIRRRALGYRLPLTLAEAAADAARLQVLNRLGVNLNQLAHHANAGRLPSHARLTDLLDRITTAMDRLDDPGPD